MKSENNYNILEGDCITTLKTLLEKSVQVCVTSPPYFNLRDYGTGTWEGGDPNCQHIGKLVASNHNFNYSDGRGSNGDIRTGVCEKCGAIKVDYQIGLEETPDAYVDKLVDVFREVKRVLKDDGTLWVNLGDSYCNSNGYERTSDEWKRDGRTGAKANDRDLTTLHNNGYKTKDLIGIPWMFAFAMRKDGWYLRQDIIWLKKNPMPESVTDRCTKSHEYIFLFSKSPEYYFDYEAIQEEAISETSDTEIRFGGSKYGDTGEFFPNKQKGIYSGNVYKATGKKRKRDVWDVAVSSYREAHFATYPEKLVEPCIFAGSKEGDTILDPFNGSGTTGIVAMKNGRKYIGCELNKEYVEMTKKRFSAELDGDIIIEASKDSGEKIMCAKEDLW